MRKALVHLHGRPAGMLIEEKSGGSCRFAYLGNYDGPSLSVSLPVDGGPWSWDAFPPFFEGMLPEGVNRESALRTHGLQNDDLFGLLLALGEDTAGAAQIFPAGSQISNRKQGDAA